MAMFNEFVKELLKFQKQLDVKFHGETHLRDHMLTAIDIPKIQIPLRVLFPRMSKNASYWILGRMSRSLRTEGRLTDHFAEDKDNFNDNLTQSDA